MFGERHRQSALRKAHTKTTTVRATTLPPNDRGSDDVAIADGALLSASAFDAVRQ